MKDLDADLAARRAAGLYRRRRVVESAQGVETRIDGHNLLSFCSNDYLGLANHPQIRDAMARAVETFGVGSGSAHLINGHSRLHEDCEIRLAEFTGRDRALLFCTGYLANLALPAALLGRKDLILQDRLNHASLIDGAQLCQARLRRYRHNDLAQLEQLLSEAERGQEKLIMTDGVFSMDGDCADVSALAILARDHDAWLMVDDAHGFGVLGEQGGGLLQQAGLNQEQVPILMATLGKAIGTAGAFIAGSAELIETLIQQARPYIFSTASPPAIAAATMCALDLIESERWRRDKLHGNIDYFRRGAMERELELVDSKTAIQPLLIGDNHAALALGEALYARGLHVPAIRPPTVPEGSARLRITLSAAHQPEQIDTLLTALTEELASLQP